MPATTINAELLPGETLTLVGPGKVEFQAAQAAKTAQAAKVANGATVAGKGIVGTNIQATMGVAKTGAAATSTAAVKAGTIWTGKGLSLGLGLGLGAWGPGLLAATVVGGYIYYRKKKTMRLWPF
ncbi:MAG: mms6 [Magnetococcales bacterium]|nr:mms6 [Magnetococcales bacterium]